MATRKVVSKSYYRDSDSSDEYENKVKFSNDHLRYLKGSPKNAKNQSPKKKFQSNDKKVHIKAKKSYQDELSKNYFSKATQGLNPRKNISSRQEFITPSNLSRKQDDQTLKAKMSTLEKSVLAQEKALQDIQQKLLDDKFVFNSSPDNRSRKTHHSRIEEERSILKRASVGKSMEKKQSSAKKQADYRIRDEDDDSENESSENEKSYAELRKSHKNYFSASNVSDRKERKRDMLENELDRKGEETVLQKKKLNEMKTHIRDVSRKYEIEVDNLKHEINILNEQNFKLRNNAISTKDQRRIEDLYAKRLKELEDAVSAKDREIAEKDGYYKSQAEDIKIKMEELQREVRKIEDYEEKVQELSQQLQLKDKEMDIIKKYYSDKLQVKADEQIKQKKDWSTQNNELILEIRTLKREIDLLEYENKKLGGHSSSLKKKEELNFVSSRRTAYDDI